MIINFRKDMIQVMFSKDVINRINKINWNLTGENNNNEDRYLIYEFLRRMAEFSMLKSISSGNPFLINIAEKLGDENYEENLSLYNQEAYKYIHNHLYIGFAIKSYVQLAFMADTKKETSKYLEIYEPFIRLLERGNELIYRSGYLDITNVCSVPINGWLERADMKPINIDDL